MSTRPRRFERRITYTSGRLPIVAPHSEVCVSMGCAGRPMLVALVNGGTAQRPYPMAQLYTPEGELFAAPITLGEAGIFEHRLNENDVYRYVYATSRNGDHGEGDLWPGTAPAPLIGGAA